MYHFTNYSMLCVGMLQSLCGCNVTGCINVEVVLYCNDKRVPKYLLILPLV